LHLSVLTFQTDNIPVRIPNEIALCLFRVLQESLQNAVKHSGAKLLQVSMVGQEGQLQLAIRDSGKGLDYEEALRSRGIGLVGMQERLKIVNGHFRVDSKPGAGTTICATVPLQLIPTTFEAPGPKPKAFAARSSGL
jgi:signal transduction histidine kinase